MPVFPDGYKISSPEKARARKRYLDAFLTLEDHRGTLRGPVGTPAGTSEPSSDRAWAPRGFSRSRASSTSLGPVDRGGSPNNGATTPAALGGAAAAGHHFGAPFDGIGDLRFSTASAARSRHPARTRRQPSSLRRSRRGAWLRRRRRCPAPGRDRREAGSGRMLVSRGLDQTGRPNACHNMASPRSRTLRRDRSAESCYK